MESSVVPVELLVIFFKPKEINKMDILDFEELTAEMLNVTDQQREDDDYLQMKFQEKYNIELDTAYELVKDLLRHTIPVEAGLSKKMWHAFVSKKQPVMLMKLEAD